MLKAGRELDLAIETFDVDAGNQIGRQNLYDDVSPQGLVARDKDARHSPAAQFAIECVRRAECVLELIAEGHRRQKYEPVPRSARVAFGMGNLTQFALVTLTSVLFIVDPIAVIPTYLVITQRETPEHRAATLRRACFAAGLILVAFALFGTLIFKIFGITIEAFRIAGGLILWVVAMDMLHGERKTQESGTEVAEGQVKEDVAVTPLAMPMLAGPGAISTIMVLAGQARTVPEKAIVHGSIIVTMLVSFLVLRAGERLVRRMGQTGVRVMTRIMGLLLAAIAVQFVITGVRDALKSLVPS
jgi:multiple antibiotic resistance protein